MAHPEQELFVAQVAGRFNQHFTRKRVLEIGSQNINGTVRQFFKNCDYIGIDCVPGKDVDIVCLAHEYDTPHQFDTVISCEAFEHDPYLDLTIKNIVRLLKPGGLFVATCASPLRKEHGTKRTAQPGYEMPHGPDENYYAGVSVDRLYTLMVDHFYPLEIQSARADLDIYAYGIRK